MKILLKYLRLLFFDIRFWIFLYFIIRLYGITNAPLEIAHNWRQVTVNMVARNFLEVDANILYPRVDMAGEKTGITGTEFPLFNYIIFLIAKLFGYSHWYGRLVNLIISSFGIFYFYKFLNKFFNHKLAIYSTIILLNSIWFSYSRKIMPDTFSTSLVIISLYYCFSYLYNGKLINLLIFFLIATLGILSKIPSIYLMSILIIPFFDKKIFVQKKIIVLISGIVLLVIISWWYFYWVPFLVEKYEYWHYYMGTSFLNGFNELISHPAQVFEKYYFDALRISGFILFLTGLVFAIIKKDKIIILIFTVSFIFFFIFMIKAGRGFYHHSYYIIPFVPVMALIAGYALYRIKIRWLIIVFVLANIVDGIVSQQHDFRIKESEKYKLEIEFILNQFSTRQDLIAINGGDTPQDIYFTHRNGWTLNNEEIFNSNKIEEIKNKGCNYLIINKKNLNLPVPESKYELIFENEFYLIYAF